MSHPSAARKIAPQPDGDQPAPQPRARRMLLVFNPTAGRRKGKLDAIMSALAARGWNVTLRETAYAGDATRIARELTEGYDVLAVAGGDGTLNEAANGLADGQGGGEGTGKMPALAVLPFGTANVLAHEIGLGIDETRVAAAAADGRPTEIYLGQAHYFGGRHPRRFLLMAGVGFDAAVVAGVSGGLKRRLGKGAYVWRMIVELFRYDFPPFVVTVDGAEYPCASAVVAKGHYYGGRFVCAPDARLTDDDFQVCLFLSKGRFAVLRYALALGLGALHKLPDVKLVRGRNVRIDGPQGAPVQGDGDIIAALPAALSVVAEPIRVMYPQ
ncbi:MAG: diacylglycerol/lipid kinase family protein [Alphaproteobacteria bacterium]